MEKLKLISINACCLLVAMAILLCTDLTAYASEDEEENSFNSVVEIESYSVDGGFIEAGKESVVLMTLHNANKITEATNLTVIVKSDSGMVYPQYGGDNQFYVGNLKAGSSTTISIPIVVSSTFLGEYVDFTCDLVYVSGGKKITSTSTMILPGPSSEDIVVNSLEVSAHAVKGNQSLLSISYHNKGADNINDAALIVDGNISESTNKIDLGSITAGKTYNKDCNIIFTESGDQTISVKIEYKDVEGETVQSDLGTFKVTVAEENGPTITEEEANPYLVWGGRCISLVALIVVAIVALMYVKKH